MSIRNIRARKSLLTRVVAWVVSAGLVLGVSSMPAPSVNATQVAAQSALSVVSDPVAAAVYVDGQLRGRTPLQGLQVSPGDHRVRVVKDGYLENSRVVAVAGGKASSLSVRLTPGTGTSTILKQVESEPQVIVQREGGSGKKIALIALGVAAVGAGAFLLLSGKNKAPVAAGSLSPTGTGMAKLTSFSFNGGASSDPDGDPLTYSWAFGDSQTGSGQTATHVYSAPGTYAVTLTVSDGKLSANAAVGTVTVMDNLTGTWTGTHSSYTNTHTFTISQSAPSFSGSWQVSGGFSPGTVSGEVRGPSSFVCPCQVVFTASAPCPLGATFTGELSADGKTLSGTGTASYGACATSQGTFQGTWTLRR